MSRILIDTVCTNPDCRKEYIDVWLVDGQYRSCEMCEWGTERLYKASSTAHAHGDECDVWIKHGLCHEDGSPRRFTSKSEIARVAKERNLYNRVEHVTTKDTDKNKNTQRWV